jgi:tetratricopeptide (TPR) repeat protein
MLKMHRRLFGLAHQLAGRTDRAIAILEKLERAEPEWPNGLAQLAAAYADSGRVDTAQGTTKKILELDPSYTASGYLSIVHFMNPERIEWLRVLLVKAGLPK